MHTISESGHTGDVLAALHLLHHTLLAMDAMGEHGMADADLLDTHPRLDQASPLAHQALEDPEEEG
jgi:hypothetical protein